MKLKNTLIFTSLFFMTLVLLGGVVTLMGSNEEEQGTYTFVTQEPDKPHKKFTLLHVANFVYSAENGDLDTVKKYIELGIDVNLQDHNKDTALMGASLNGHEEIMDLLLQHKADPSIKNAQGYSSLDYSQILGKTKLTDKLSHYVPNSRTLSSSEK